MQSATISPYIYTPPAQLASVTGLRNSYAAKLAAEAKKRKSRRSSRRTRRANRRTTGRTNRRH